MKQWWTRDCRYVWLVRHASAMRSRMHLRTPYGRRTPEAAPTALWTSVTCVMHASNRGSHDACIQQFDPFLHSIKVQCTKFETKIVEVFLMKHYKDFFQYWYNIISIIFYFLLILYLKKIKKFLKRFVNAYNTVSICTYTKK